RGRADEAAADVRPFAPDAGGHVPARPESRLPRAKSGHRVRIGDLQLGARACGARAPGLHVRAPLPPRRTNGQGRVHRTGRAAVASDAFELARPPLRDSLTFASSQRTRAAALHTP